MRFLRLNGAGNSRITSAFSVSAALAAETEQSTVNNCCSGRTAGCFVSSVLQRGTVKNLRAAEFQTPELMEMYKNFHLHRLRKKEFKVSDPGRGLGAAEGHWLFNPDPQVRVPKNPHF